MVECKICGKQYNRIGGAHLKTHGVTKQEYLGQFPTAELISIGSKEKYSNATRRCFAQDPEKFRSRIKNRKYTEESKQKISQAVRAKTPEQRAKSYTVERNKKISEKKKQYWAAMTAEQRSSFIKNKVVPVVRKNMGEEEYLLQLRQKGIQGYNNALSKGKKKELNKFEQRMVDVLTKAGLTVVPQYNLAGWYYDCYIPSMNLLIEFDGDYWHPVEISEKSSKREIKQFNIDRRKELLAEEQGYKLVRVRESEEHLLLLKIKQAR